jgi:hypothetical protein
MKKLKNILVIAIGVSTMWMAGCACIPSHSIVAWYSTSGSIPLGWVICDGNNKTPDLRGRFIRGVGDIADTGKIGGSETHTHTFSGTTDNPRSSNTDAWHSDGMNRNGAPATTGLDHTHRFNGVTDPASNLPPYFTMVYIMKE